MKDNINAEALKELFRSKGKKVMYNGIEVEEYWPGEVEKAQEIISYTVNSQAFPRIAFGQENNFDETNVCESCAVLKGQLHVPGCDVEECPKCNQKALLCDCEKAEYM